MQAIALPSFSQYGWFRPAPQSSSLSGFVAHIPNTFSEDQAHFVLALKKAGLDREEAAWLLGAWAPTRFGAAQAVCVLDMLDLDAQDLAATLADAMEPGPLRGRLMRGLGPRIPGQAALDEEIARAVDRRRACRARHPQ